MVQIPISAPAVSDEDMVEMARVIRTGQLTQGPEVASLEQELAHSLGARYAAAVSSGTAALHCALMAVGVRGHEVISSPFSFVASANAIVMAGAEPIFADIDLDTYNLSMPAAAAVVSGRTRA